MTMRNELRRMLAIGGSDSCGGAGIQADTKTGTAMGVDVSTAITAITAQNSLGVQAIEPISAEMLRAQIASVCSDIPPHAVKLGMLYDAHRVSVVADAIATFGLKNIVCDPVLISTSGTTLLDSAGRDHLVTMLPLFTLFTPNAVEAAALTGLSVHTSSNLVAAGRVLLEKGANAVLLKGGHLSGEHAIDLLLQRNSPEPVLFPSERVETRNDHGTGCVLASAIASALAHGAPLVKAVRVGCSFVHAAIHRSAQLWTGAGRGSMKLLQ